MDDAPLLQMFAEYQRTRRHLAVTTITVRHNILKGIASELPAGLLAATTEELELALDRRKLAVSSRLDYVCHLARFYEWAVKAGHAAGNPAAELTKPRKPKRLPKPISEAELKRLLMHVGYRRPLRTWVVLGAYAGLRRHEIANLTTDCIDFDANTLRIKGKGGRERVVPMHSTVEHELRLWTDGALPGPLWPVGERTVGQALTRAMAGAGIKGGTPHRLRHRFATAAYQATEDLGVVGALLGHSSLDTTRGYAALGTDRLRKAVGGIE